MMTDTLTQFLPVVIVQGVVAFALWPVLKRTTGSPWLWAILLMIPFVGFIPPWFIVANGICRALDRIDP